MKYLNVIRIALLAAVITYGCEQPGAKQEQKETKSETVEKEAAPNTLSQSEVDEGWVLLFDGTSADQWRGYLKDSFPDHGWAVEDGVLKVLGSGRGEAGGGGDIITKKKYRNFEFSVDWKISEGGNSGIFYLAQEIPDEPIWKSSPELQLLDNERHPDAKLGVDGNRTAGSLYDLIPGDTSLVNPAGEWNTSRVMVYKGTVVHYMNGEPVVEYHLWTDDWKNMVKNSKFKNYDEFLNTAEEGFIGLQDHGDEVWFRNIKIKELK